MIVPIGDVALAVDMAPSAVHQQLYLCEGFFTNCLPQLSCSLKGAMHPARTTSEDNISSHLAGEHCFHLLVKERHRLGREATNEQGHNAVKDTAPSSQTGDGAATCKCVQISRCQDAPRGKQTIATFD